MNFLSILLSIFLGLSYVVNPSQSIEIQPEPHKNEEMLNRTKVPLSEEKIELAMATKATILAEYTLLVIMEGDNNLHSMGDFNLQQMMKIPTSTSVNILVQRHKPNSNLTLRYKVEQGRILDVGSINKPLGVNPEQEVFDAAEWAIRTYPSKHFILDLWNHGGGAEERGKSKNWLLPAGASEVEEASRKIDASQSKDIVLPEDQKGILYSDTTGKFLSNEAMSRVCSRISRELLGGRKIDIVGCDACLMQGFEIGWGLKNSADFLVASTNTEPGQGWSYDDFLGELVAKRGLMTPELVCHKIVEAYANFYTPIAKDYTQSYVRTSQAGSVLDCLNKISIDILNLKSYSRDIAHSMLTTACTQTMYIHENYADLQSFAEEVSALASKYYSTYIKYSSQSGYREIINCLINVTRDVADLKNAIKNYVGCSRAGSAFPGTCGVSIYLPRFTHYYPTSSYITSLFGRNSMWSKMLTMFCYETRDARDFLDVPEYKPAA